MRFDGSQLASRLTSQEQERIMTVAELIEKLQQMPSEAVVLLESEAGFARVAGVNFEKSVAIGLPDEVVLFTDAEE
jgi:hypothetical protein